MKRILFILGLMITTISMSYAKSGRVIEVQEKIKIDVAKFLEKFSPNTKYSVKVKIKPLRRKYTDTTREDNLPFMEFQEDFMVDEWDDPKTSIYSLYSRISEARVSIYIEDNVKIEDRSRFKEALLNDVNLIPGRDSVSIEAISTPVLQTAFNWRDQTEVLLLGVMLIIAVILGVGLNSLSKRVVPQQVSSEVPSNNSGAPIAAAPVAPIPAQPIAGNAMSSLSELKGDLNIQDPSKLNDVVSKKVSKLVESEMFPTLSDMITLEELFKNDPSGFSYLVYEFPVDVQKAIYQLGKGEQWFKGFSEVGFPSKVVLIALDTMLRNREVKHSEKFEKLLIHSWRLGKDFVSFAKNLTKEQAFSLLYFLPKDISIPVARECYPGSWGNILEHNNTVSIKEDNEIQIMIQQTLTVNPYLNYDSLQVFKNRKDLLRYLDSVEPHEEKDIYSVMGEDNDLSTIRPPFFKFFDLSIEDRRDVFKKFTLAEWALAAFNVERNEKELITELMDDKERYLFGLTLQSYDQNPVLTQDKYRLRQTIAKFVFDQFTNSKLDSTEKNFSTDNEVESDAA